MFCTISDMYSGGAWICSVLSVTCVVGGLDMFCTISDMCSGGGLDMFCTISDMYSGGPGYVLYYQ